MLRPTVNFMQSTTILAFWIVMVGVLTGCAHKATQPQPIEASKQIQNEKNSVVKRQSEPEPKKTQPQTPQPHDRFTLLPKGQSIDFPDGKPAIRVVPAADSCVEISYWMEGDTIEEPYKKGTYCYNPYNDKPLPDAVSSRECVLPWIDIAKQWLKKDDPKDLYPYTESRIDLDGDGAEDILIAPRPCGKIGCAYNLYLMRGNCGYKIGEHTANLLVDYPTTETNGWRDLYMIGLEIRRHGFYSYFLKRYVFDGSQYVPAATRACILPVDEKTPYCQDWVQEKAIEGMVINPGPSPNADLDTMMKASPRNDCHPPR